VGPDDVHNIVVICFKTLVDDWLLYICHIFIVRGIGYGVASQAGVSSWYSARRLPLTYPTLSYEGIRMSPKLEYTFLGLTVESFITKRVERDAARRAAPLQLVK